MTEMPLLVRCLLPIGGALMVVGAGLALRMAWTSAAEKVTGWLKRRGE